MAFAFVVNSGSSGINFYERLNMPFYEIAYEDGSMSVACYEDDAEAERALSAAHARAVSGQAAISSTTPDEPFRAASRIRAVFKYNKHPDDYNAGQKAAAKDVKAAVDAALGEEKTVGVHDVAAVIRDLSNPFKPAEPFESRYKMEEVEELAPNMWEGK